MSFLSRLFGSDKPGAVEQQAPKLTQREQDIQAAANQLWEMLKEIMALYYADGCACEYPRFHQYVQIDCTDMGKSFYMSETEGFIAVAGPYFDVKEIPRNIENYKNQFTCKTCGSVYENGWSDFSIHVSRSYLKIIDKKVIDKGAEAKEPIPFYVGLFGHALPPSENFVKVDIEAMRNYLLETKTIN